MLDKFHLADAEHLPFEGSYFDLVTCRITPHYFPDCQKFVNAFARVLKKEGLRIIQDHVLPEHRPTARYVDKFEILRDPSHNQAFSEKEWRAIFNKGGFSIEHTEQIVKQHEFLNWVDRIHNSDDTLRELIQMVQNGPKCSRSCR